MRSVFATTLLVASALAFEPIHNAEEKAKEKVEEEVDEAVDELSDKVLDWKFASYCAQFGKMYDTLTDYEKRKKWFRKMDIKIRIHNHKAYKKYKQAHNFFSDLFDDEKAMYLGYKPLEDGQLPRFDTSADEAVLKSSDGEGVTVTGDNGKILEFDNSDRPDSVDWRD